MAETAVFNIDVQPAIKSLATLQTELDKARIELLRLNASETATAEERIKQQVIVKSLTKEYNGLTNAVVQQTTALTSLTAEEQENIKTNNFQENSIVANRKAYNALYNELLRVAKPTKDQIATVQNLNKTLKEQEKALGNTTRNVGNYEEGMKGALSQVFSGIKGIEGFRDALKNSVTGFKAAEGGARGFGAGLAALGLPIIITAVEGLISAFKAFKPVADAIEDVVTAISAGFGALISGGNIKEAVNQSLSLLNVMRDLEDTQDAFNIQQSKSTNEVNRLIVASKDVTKTFEERKKLLETANEIEQTQHEAALKRNRELLEAQSLALKSKLRIGVEDLRLLAEGTSAEALALRERLERNKAGRKLDEEELKAFQATIKERAELNGQSLTLQEKIANRLASLNEKENDEREKLAEQEKARLEKLAQEREKYNQIISNLTTEFVLNEREKLSRGFDEKLKQITGEGEIETNLRIAIESKRQQTLAKFDADNSQKIFDAESKKRQTLLQLEEDSLNKRLQAFDIAFESQEKALREAGATEVQIAEFRNKQIADITSKFLDEDSKKKMEANVKEFNEAIAHSNALRDHELSQVDLSVASEADKAQRKREIQLKYLNEQLLMTEKLANADDKLTQSEEDNLRKLRDAIAETQSEIKKGDEQVTLAQSIGITEEDINKMNEAVNIIQTAVNGISTILNANYENRLAEIENQKVADINAINETYQAQINAINNSTLSEEQKKKKIDALNKKQTEETKAREKQAAKSSYEIQKKQFETNKALQIVNAIIATALGVVNAFQLGPIAGAIAAAAIGITGAAQIAMIASQQPPPPPAFAKGVIGLNGAGTETSDSITSKLSRGESVITAKATKAFAPQLAAMEIAVGNKPNFQLGGRKFANGFIPTDGGFSARSLSSQINANNINAKAMQDAVSMLPAPVLVYDEFNQFKSTTEKSVTISEL